MKQGRLVENGREQRVLAVRGTKLSRDRILVPHWVLGIGPGMHWDLTQPGAETAPSTEQEEPQRTIFARESRWTHRPQRRQPRPMTGETHHRDARLGPVDQAGFSLPLALQQPSHKRDTLRPPLGYPPRGRG